ncbi:MAG: hypothetical protein ABI205_06065, partial [Gemmatimonadaceae bacterium]
MFRALRSVFSRRPDAAQLSFALEGPPRDAMELLVRLRALGMRRIDDCRLTRNRNVMVSFRGRDLRVHEGYLAAPDDVHRAIVAFVEGRTRAERRVAQQKIVAFRVDVPRAPARRERTRPEDEPLAARFVEWHGRYNAEHFG